MTKTTDKRSSKTKGAIECRYFCEENKGIRSLNAFNDNTKILKELLVGADSVTTDQLTWADIVFLGGQEWWEGQRKWEERHEENRWEGKMLPEKFMSLEC